MAVGLAIAGGIHADEHAGKAANHFRRQVFRQRRGDQLPRGTGLLYEELVFQLGGLDL